MKPILAFCLCLSALGCQSYQTRTYDISVKNNSSGPVTVWLTKDGPPFEPGWLAPEDIATESPKQPVRMISGLVIAPGKEAFTGPRKGRFEADTKAVLRIYSGQLNFDQLLASDQDDKRRIDTKLHPGVNDLVVTGEAGKIEVKEPAGAP
jgi:hypothetical protein